MALKTIQIGDQPIDTKHFRAVWTGTMPHLSHNNGTSLFKPGLGCTCSTPCPPDLLACLQYLLFYQLQDLFQLI